MWVHQKPRKQSRAWLSPRRASVTETRDNHSLSHGVDRMQRALVASRLGS